MNNKTISDRGLRLAGRRSSRKVNQNQENNVSKPKSKVVRRGDKRSVSEMSPSKTVDTRKRTAFGDITNAIHHHSERIALGRKKGNVSNVECSKPKLKKPETVTKNKSKVTIFKASVKSTKHPPTVEIPDSLCSELISSSNEKCTIMEEGANDFSLNLDDGTLTKKFTSRSLPVPDLSFIEEDTKSKTTESKEDVFPPNVRQFDLDEDPFVVSEYAPSIFRNMMKREMIFSVRNYLSQPNSETTGPMRAILVDWLVEVQENFELYHETLYLAVKITDVYLQNNPVPKEQLQLIGATALFIACKLEERHPPPLDDFQFICDDAYTHELFVDTELKIFKALNFDINVPIPYRFLRRFARASSMSMQLLTLARYTLELSIHEADFVDVRPSKIAAACLCLAIKMKKECTWDETLTYYTTYAEEDLTDLVKSLNKMLIAAPSCKLQTVRTKYLHPIFYEVAKIEPLKDL